MGTYCKEPNHRVADGLVETGPDTSFALILSGIHLDTIVCKLSLFGGEPLGGQRCVGQDEVTDHRNHKRNRALEDEEPAPASNASHVIESMEDTRSDETGEGGGKNIASVEDCNAGGKFLTVVEQTENVDCTGVVRCFRQAEEESG